MHLGASAVGWAAGILALLAIFLVSMLWALTFHPRPHQSEPVTLPHPRIRRAVGLTLATLSKNRIGSATRHQLSLIPGNFVTQQFNLKRAVLGARLPIQGEGEFVALNTHLDAFAQGTNTMEKQVDEINSLLNRLTQSGRPWLIGGDFKSSA